MTAVISTCAAGAQARDVRPRDGKPRDQRAARLRARFEQTRRYQAALLVPVGGAVLLLATSRRYAADVGFGPILLGAAFLLGVAVGCSWIFWRCPACRRHLGLRWRPHCCVSCGFVLEPR